MVGLISSAPTPDRPHIREYAFVTLDNHKTKRTFSERSKTNTNAALQMLRKVKVEGNERED